MIWKNIMSQRIKFLIESPCYRCGCQSECDKKIKKVPKFSEIRDIIFENGAFNFHNCPLWIAINAPEMIDES